MNNPTQLPDLTHIRLPDIFKPIVVGYASAVTALSWAFVLVVLVPGIFSGADAVNSDGAPIPLWQVALGMIAGVPLIAVLQGVMIAFLCGFGLAVYRKVF